MNFNLDEFADLLLHNHIGQPLYNFSPDRRIYFIKIENDFESECIYKFWEHIGIDVIETGDDIYKNRKLIDI